MCEHPLHRNADLACMIKTTLGEERQRVVEISILGNDDRCSPTMFQSAARSRRKLGAKHPPHIGAADEAEETDAAIRHELFSDGQIRDRHRLAPAIRQASLSQELDEFETDGGRIVSRFDDDRATAGNRRADLVHDEIERVVEGADRDHHTDGFASAEGNAVCRGRIELHRDFSTMLAPDALDTILDPIDGAFEFDTGIDQRLATFEHRDLDQRIEALAHEFGRALENGYALMGGKPGVSIKKQLARDAQSLLSARLVDRPYCCDRLAIIRRRDAETTGFLGIGNLKTLVQWFSPICPHCPSTDRRPINWWA